MKKNLLKVVAIAAIGFAFNSETNAQNWLTSGNAATDTATNYLGTTDAVGLKIKTNNVDRVWIGTNGRVGIGTNAPVNNLDVVSNGAVTSGIRSLTAGATMSMDRGLGTANAAFAYKSLGVVLWNSGILGNDNFTIRNAAAGTNVMIITPANNVGIGTGSPTQKLDVNGNINTSGNLTATGTLTATGGNSTNWNTAFGWGNHAVAGYLTTETDPQVGLNTTNYASKWDGSALVTSNIFSNGTFVGINTTTAIGAAQLVVGNSNAGFGGMYLNSGGVAGARKPFYGYALGGSSSVWTYLDEATGSWRVYNGGDKLTVESSGQVGIGTNTPNYYLDIQAGTALRALNAVSSVVGSSGQIVNFERTSAPSAANDILQITVPAGSPDDFQYIEADRGGVVSFAVNGSGATGLGGSALSGVSLYAQLGSDASPTGGGYIVSGSTSSANVAIDNNEIMARNNGAVSPLYIQNSGGNILMCNAGGQVTIGIGTPATGYLLSVDGKVIAEEVRVELSGSWPDYVFSKNYNKLSIDELESYVNEFNHLPGVAAASELESNGLDLGKMQTVMMEKTEENTLYIIELNNKIKELEKKIELLTKNK